MEKSRFGAFVPFSGESTAEMDRPRSGRGLIVTRSSRPSFKEPLCGFSSPKTNVVTEPRYLDPIWTTARYCWPCFPMAVTLAGSGVMERILQQRTHQLREFRVRGVVLLNNFFAPRIASFAGLKTEPNHVFGGNIRVRAFLLCFYELPNPGTTNSPFFLAALKANLGR